MHGRHPHAVCGSLASKGSSSGVPPRSTGTLEQDWRQVGFRLPDCVVIDATFIISCRGDAKGALACMSER